MIRKKTRYIDKSNKKRDQRIVTYLSEEVMKIFLAQKKKDLFWNNSEFLEHIILEYLSKNTGTSKAQCKHCGSIISNETS